MSAKKTVSKAPKKAARKFTKKAPSPPSYDELTAERIRSALRGNAVTEKRMFGGITMMVNGNMLCCASPRGLMIRVGAEGEAAALAKPAAAPCTATGRRMAGFVMVGHAGLATAREVESALRLAHAYVKTLPAKAAVPARR